MADYRVIQKLDEKLIAEGIIDKAYKADYRLVHSKLNSHFKKSGAILPEKVFEKGELILRKWLGILYKKGASQEKVTSYLRCGLAHLSFDFIESSYKSISDDDLITRTLLSFKNRDFHKTFFKATDTAILIKKKRTAKKKSVKKAAVKKAQKKKISAKPVRKKKIVKKKISKSKTKPKKSPAKKTAKKSVKKKVKKN